MNEDELIELIQSRLPQDLTPRQIHELRVMMRTSPKLRDALLEELSLEQGLATKYAPAVERVDEIVTQIARAAAARSRTRWLMINFGLAFCIAAVVAGVLLGVHLLAEPPEAAPPGDPAQQQRLAASRPAASRPAQPTTRQMGPAVAAVSPGSPGPRSRPAPRPSPAGGSPKPTPAGPSAKRAGTPVPAAPPPEWKLFDAPPRMGGRILREHFRRAFKDVSNTYVRMQKDYLDVRGRYALNEKLKPGRLLRIAPFDVKQLTLDAWHGSAGVRFARGSDGALKAFLLSRSGGDVVCQLAGSDARWRYFNGGPLDLRYQDANVVLASADVPLFCLPLAGPPDKVGLEIQGRIASASLLDGRPLRLTRRTWGQLVVDSGRLGGLGWEPDQLKNVEVTKHPDGSVEVLGRKVPSETNVLTELTPRLGKRISVELRDVAHRTGFIFRLQGGRRHVKYYVIKHRGVHVLTTDPDNSRSRDQAFEGGLVVRDALWLRLGFGLDCADIDFSADGRNWARLVDTKLESREPADKPVQFGVFLYKGRDCRARLTRIRIEQRDIFAGLADPALVRRVPDANEVLAERDIDKIWPAVAAVKPAGVAAWRWRLACDAALIARSPYPVIRAACAIDLLQTAVKHVDDTDALLAGAVDLAELSYKRDSHAPAFEALVPFYQSLAQRCFAAGRRDRLPQIVDSWLHEILPRFRYRWDVKDPLPSGMARWMIHDLLDREAWEPLAYQSGRLLALQRSAKGEMPHRSSGEGEARLMMWAQEQARSAVVGPADEDATVWSGAWTHPLTVQLDRETLNVISEFVASINAKAYGHAAKVLASQLLPDGIVPTDADGQLYQAIHFRIRQLLQTHPELARQLRERYEPIGTVRLQRALRDGDVETLQSLVVQFHGTRPARQALYRLADRDLSMGNVVGAAAKYSTLLEAPFEPQRDELAAKYRLASALAGQLVGRPVQKPVHLPGKHMSAGEFEAMIASLVKSRRTGGGHALADAARPPAPGPGKVEASELTSISADKEDRSRPFTRRVAWALRGRDLIIHQRGRLTAVNLDSRKTLWSQQESLRSSSDAYSPAAWPVVAGDRLYARVHSRREALLACLDARSGKVLWQQRYDEGVLSDPILVNSWLYVLTCRTALGGLAEIYLRRISPETGRSAMAARLVALRQDSRLLSPGGMALVGEAIVFRCSATLVCCDLLGEVRWIRRLTFVPPDVDRSLLDEMTPDRIVVHGSRVIFAAPACPNIDCVDVRTGREVWSYLQPDLRRLVGLVAGNVIVVTAGHVEALDAASGKPAWQVARTADIDAIVPAGNDTLVTVTLDRVDPKKRTRYGRDIRRIRWLSATDGSTVRSEAVEDAALYDKLYDATRLYSTGKELVCLAAYDTKRRSARVFRVRIR